MIASFVLSEARTEGLDYPTNQAHGYEHSFRSCKVVIATNGYCYQAFERVGDTFSTQPSAHLTSTVHETATHLIQRRGAALFRFLSYSVANRSKSGVSGVPSSSGEVQR
jgi:hypothetical protein